MAFESKKAVYPGLPGTTVPLSRGLVAFVSLQDLPLVADKNWYALKVKNGYYAASNAPMVGGVRGKTILMHAVILGVTGADHKDGNGLNNRRENLRSATKSQNAVNSKRRNTSSLYRGVNWDNTRQKWAAYIRIAGKSKNLGRFDTEKEAADAYLQAAKAAYGDFVYQPRL